MGSTPCAHLNPLCTTLFLLSRYRSRHHTPIDGTSPIGALVQKKAHLRAVLRTNGSKLLKDVTGSLQPSEVLGS